MTMRHLLPTFLRLRFVALLLLALPAVLAAQPARAQFLAGQLEGLLSTDERQVTIEGLSGALSGNVRIEQVTVADRDGVWLTARDLALDWSPLALVRKNVSIETLTAGQITLDRLPRPSTAPADPDAAPFSLPSITANVGRIAIAEFVLGEAVAGIPARLSAEASLTLAPDPAQLDATATIRRLDQPGDVALRLGFQPGANRLEIAVTASEPAGGIVAGLLEIPGAPPVALAINGSGPFDDFAANGTLDLGTERAATLDATVRNGAEGRRIAGTLTALTAPFVPEQYGGVVGADLALDADVLLRPDGVVAIDAGRLVSGALQLTAAGTLDRNGAGNDLTVTLRTDAGNPIALGFGAAGSRTALEISSLDAVLRGALNAATLDLTAAARTAGFGDYVLNEVTAKATSPGFDLLGVAGPVLIEAGARNASVSNTTTGQAQAIAARVLEGPIALKADGALAADGLTFNAANLTTGAASLALSGQAALDFSTFGLRVDSDFETAALAREAVPYVGERVRIGTDASRGADGSLGLQNLVVDGDALDIAGSASLTGEEIAAAITGQLNQAAIADSALNGEARFDLKASGTIAAPAIDLTATASDLLVAGRTLNDLNARIQGTFAPEAPAGTIALGGTYNGAPLALTADLATEGGRRILRNLLVRQGENRLDGEVALDGDDRPSGNLRVAVPDAATLLALAGQDGSGDLAGTVTFAVGNGGTPVADVALDAGSFTLGTQSLENAEIDLRLTDFLARPLAAGTVRAAAIRAGSLAAERLDATLETVNAATAINASVLLNAVPTRLSGDLAVTDAGTVVNLRTLTAEIPNAALSLAEPATVTLGSPLTTLGRIRLDAAEGSLTVSGTLGDTYDLALALDRFPVAVANPFVADLSAAGTVSGSAALKGPAAAPDADFDLRADGIATAQTRAARIEAVDAAIAGQYRDGTATLRAARIDLGEGSIDATGTVGDTLDLALRLTDIPVALANGFVDGLDAEGLINGTADATGSLANPAVTFDIAGTGITAAEVRRAGVAPLVLDLSGVYRGGTARLETARVTVGDGRIEATGSVGRALDLKIDIVDLPAALANGVRPGLDAAGTIAGTAAATGSISNPAATFQLAGTGLTAAPLRRSGLAPAAVDLAGSYADGTARFERARVNVGDGSLEATGTVGRALDLRVALTALPVALANAVRPELDARGTLSGSASATGSITDPAASFDLRAQGVSVAQTRAAGAPALDAVATGSYADGTATIGTARIDLGTGSVTASGTVGERLDLSVTLEDIPASLANAAAPGIAPTGTLNGTVRAAGTIASPNVQYDLRVGALTLQQTRDAGVGPLDIAANGTYADNRVTLDSRLTGSGLAFTAAGSVGVAGTPTFDLRLDGTAPLSIANRILAENGRSVQGTVRVSAAVTGTPANPNVVGSVSTSGASFVDTGANLSLRNINANVALSGTTATLQGVTAEFAAGGTLSVAGTIGLGAGFPADLRIDVDQGRYADGELVAVRLDAALTLTGPLTGNAVLGGTIDASEINILVPDNLPTSLARIDLDRRNTPAAVLQQIREIDPNSGKAAAGSAGGGISLDVTLNAPNRVFVRGRGLDLELGGTIRITGPVSNLGIAGGFELQRGRFQLLSRRLDFERATLTFDGNLVPTLDLLATSDTGEVTVNIAITGPATSPAFNFSSSPALPQDEVLARLIFGQGTADLSPLQIAQLASAAAQLAGVGGSTNLLDSLRSQLGVDDLDIRTNADGQTSVGVGRYLNDNTYVGVDSTGRVAIDLELGANVKARGAVTATGGGEVGLFYEREY